MASLIEPSKNDRIRIDRRPRDSSQRPSILNPEPNGP